ncbi:hypothetical protein M0805_005491 [Coniferiporia weirii]|nr:hypothetical protein M0805_005491 [Coniferiporia weirii]
MFDASVDGASFVARAASAHVELAARDNFIFDIIKNILFVKYYAIASVTVLYFDHAVTLPTEIQRIWCTRFTGATALFLLNRYVPFFGFIPILLSLFNPPFSIVFRRGEQRPQLGSYRESAYLYSRRCRKFAPFIGALSVFSNAIAAVILILRTYALYGRALWVLVLTGFIGAASVVIGGWSASSVMGELFDFKPLSVCVPMFLEDNRGLRLAWISTFVFDFVVFLLTIVRSYRFVRAQANPQMQSDLATLVMRDGSIYFLVMSVVNAANFVLSSEISNSFFASATGTNSLLAQVISVTMISRLLLNLREESMQYGQRHSSGPLASASQTLTDANLVFTTRIIGNLTADLDGYGSSGSSSGRVESYYYGDDSESYELQSLSTRSGRTAPTGHIGADIVAGVIDLEHASTSGTRTVAASLPASASASGSGSESGKSSRGGKGKERGRSRLAWPHSMHSLSSASERTRGRNTGRSARTPQRLSSLSPESAYIPPFLDEQHSYPPDSPYLRVRGRDSDDGVEGDEDERYRETVPAVPVLASGTSEAIEMTRPERRPRGLDSSHENDPYHGHYREALFARSAHELDENG